MTMTRAKSKKAAFDICSEISNKISTREALSVVEATRQNILKAFLLPSIRDKLSLVVTKATSSFLAGFLPVKVPSKRHTWIQHLVLLAPPLQEKWSKKPKVQKKTESSSLLVFGAISGGAWETITNYQRFAGWVPSTLVLGAIFKIKLAHVKTVFQLVHGFLGAKSVSKDNVKLFCLASSVHLATLKIAKFLVVSESGSPSATVMLCDVLLGVSAADIKTAFSVFGSIICVVLKPAGVWQYVVVYFEKLDSAVSALDHWSILTILSHDKFKTKLVNLPSGCTAFEISDIISQFALVMFGSQVDLDSAVVKTEVGHLAVDCKVSPPPSPKALKVFKPRFVGSLSYAKASASPVMSGFSPLVASTLFVAVVDPAVKSRLDFLEKQILDLAVLVKSIVEPVGSLVALVSHLLDDNAVKTVQLEKDLLFMKYAFNNFANFLVGIFKNIACLRSEVDFSGMNYDDIQAAKSSLLSKNTVKHVIALWWMSGAKVRNSVEFTRLFLSEFIFDSRNLNGIIEKIHELKLFLPSIVSV
ncbi:hypothetical protein G9A89_015972 [Geosiphon pyriformis]|nr:hypothetical protein G9A89_015972 [Geosiphon pyriformis]